MSQTLTVTEVNCTTGETTERPFTEEEMIQYEADKAAYEADQAAWALVAEEKATAKASAEAKLLALGLTAEEISALAN
jgi:hypothetical protein